MDPRLGRAAFQIGLFMLLGAGAGLLAVDRGTPEFFVSLLSLAIALVFIGAIVLITRMRGE